MVVNLGWAHGPPNAVTYWRCPNTSCQKQGLLYGRYSPLTAKKAITALTGTCGDYLPEVTVYELPAHLRKDGPLG